MAVKRDTLGADHRLLLGSSSHWVLLASMALAVAAAEGRSNRQVARRMIPSKGSFFDGMIRFMILFLFLLRPVSSLFLLSADRCYGHFGLICWRMVSLLPVLLGASSASSPIRRRNKSEQTQILPPSIKECKTIGYVLVKLVQI